MKKLFLLSFLFICCKQVNAQKLELGLGGGVGTNSIPKNSAGSVVSTSAKGNYNYAVSLKALTNVMKKWQFGLGIDIQPISRESDTTKHIFAAPGTAIYLMANRKLGYHFYTGLRFGFMAANNAYAFKYEGNSLTPVQINYEQSNGYTGGLQVGYVKSLGNRFDFNAEIGVNYAKNAYSFRHVDNKGVVTTGDDHYSYTFYSVMIGLRLKLFNDPFRQW